MNSTIKSLDKLVKDKQKVTQLVTEIVKKQDSFVSYNSENSPSLKNVFQTAFDCHEIYHEGHHFLYGKKLLKDILTKASFKILKKANLHRDYGLRRLMSQEVIYYDSIYIFDEYNLFLIDGFVSLYSSTYLPTDLDIYPNEKLLEIAKLISNEQGTSWCRCDVNKIHSEKLKEMIQNQKILE